jgi:hypothetical protein
VAELVGWLTDVSRPEDGNRAIRKALDREHIARRRRRPRPSSSPISFPTRGRSLSMGAVSRGSIWPRKCCCSTSWVRAIRACLRSPRRSRAMGWRS